MTKSGVSNKPRRWICVKYITPWKRGNWKRATPARNFPIFQDWQLIWRFYPFRTAKDFKKVNWGGIGNPSRRNPPRRRIVCEPMWPAYVDGGHRSILLPYLSMAPPIRLPRDCSPRRSRGRSPGAIAHNTSPNAIERRRRSNSAP